MELRKFTADKLITDPARATLEQQQDQSIRWLLMNKKYFLYEELRP
ncbi:hypothetical protein [Enterococcus xiangfangensis]|uniref:Uncharacterized protein n=1 Tax=Enterococcus xiangfangensis TaxID=1296537 RepID=A0ABU3FGJ1_9ENTE|nr:hypothetical protein [Enterococcus xiangfangensis]MDT2760775.1 hypothetical protein [Enterococcus xiangfangensis]